MPTEIYKKLRRQLDQYSCGFPLTESGVEFKILERIFTEEEAEMFHCLSLKLETPEEIAGRLGRDPDVVAALLRRMGEKGNVFSWHKGETTKYGTAPYIMGLYEFQLKAMDGELAGLCEQYFREAFLDHMTKITPLMRAIPVDRSIEAPHIITTYDDSREMIESKKIISLTQCVCRVQQNLIDEGCGKPLEICMSFGATAQHYIDQGLGRRIGLEEALKALDVAEEAACVIQISNTLNPGGLCCCCGDCCAILRSLNMMSRPADIVVSNYFAIADSGLCSGCEVCLERCQMGAIELNDDGIAQINMDRCIGCGLCVTRCPAEALHLERKPDSQLYIPPATGMDALEMMAHMRGKSLVID